MFYYIYQYAGKVSVTELCCFLLAYVLVIAFSVSIHEFSHAFVAYKCGDNTPKMAGRLTLNPFKHFDGLGLAVFMLVGFGWAKPVPVNPFNFRSYKKNNAFVSVSGIVINFALAFAFSGLSYFFGATLIASSNWFLVFLGYFIKLMVSINLSLAIFNMLPVYPLDAFNFWATFVSANCGYIRFMRKYGSIILLILVVCGLYYVYANYVFSAFDWLFSSFWGLF